MENNKSICIINLQFVELQFDYAHCDCQAERSRSLKTNHHANNFVKGYINS